MVLLLGLLCFSLAPTLAWLGTHRGWKTSHHLVKTSSFGIYLLLCYMYWFTALRLDPSILIPTFNGLISTLGLLWFPLYYRYSPFGEHDLMLFGFPISNQGNRIVILDILLLLYLIGFLGWFLGTRTIRFLLLTDR